MSRALMNPETGLMRENPAYGFAPESARVIDAGIRTATTSPRAVIVPREATVTVTADFRAVASVT